MKLLVAVTLLLSGHRSVQECSTTASTTARGPQCASEPCRNCGECMTFSNFDRYICRCLPGFSGINCEKVCGRPVNPPRMFATRIVGGAESIPHSLPWMVRIDKHCGGSLISDSWVLTAAHCVKFRSSVEVLLGAHDLAKSDKEEPTRVRQNISRRNFYMHPMLRMFPSLKNDVALVHLVNPVSFSAAIQPVCLPRPGESIETGNLMLVAGWGQTLDYNTNSNVLRQALVPIFSHKDCVALYGKDDIGDDYVNDDMLCAGYAGGGVDACTGDSGSPMIRRRPEGSFVQTGIVSFGSGCADPNSPGAYVRMASYIDWIESVTKQRVLS